MATTLRPLIIFSISVSLFLLSSAQSSCKSYEFKGGKTFEHCNDLPLLNSYIHYTYNGPAATLQLAYRHTGVPSGKWASWGINPYGTGMVGSQALVAYQRQDGSIAVYTTPLMYYQVTMMPVELTLHVSNLSATYANNEIVIFATLLLPENKTTINHVWQDGPLSGDTANMHDTTTPHLMSKGTLDVISGRSFVNLTVPDNSWERIRNLHRTLNILGWGVMMPIGIMLARYVKVIESADPAWFYIHAGWQTLAYIVGVTGWVIGLQMGSSNRGTRHLGHKALGITLFCLATLQVFALFLRPKKDHKYRDYWNIYHKLVGCLIVIIAIVNIFIGLNILSSGQTWKNAYSGTIVVLFLVGLLLEFYTYNVIQQRTQMIGIVRLQHRQFGNNASNGYEGSGYEGRNRYGF